VLLWHHIERRLQSSVASPYVTFARCPEAKLRAPPAPTSISSETLEGFSRDSTLKLSRCKMRRVKAPVKLLKEQIGHPGVDTAPADVSQHGLSLRSAYLCFRLLHLGFVSPPPPSGGVGTYSQWKLPNPCTGRAPLILDRDQALAWVFAVLAVAISVAMSRITVIVAFLPGSIFAALLEQDLQQAMSLFAIATAWYIASPALGAGARQCGRQLASDGMSCLFAMLPALT